MIDLQQCFANMAFLSMHTKFNMRQFTQLHTAITLKQFLTLKLHFMSHRHLVVKYKHGRPVGNGTLLDPQLFQNTNKLQTAKVLQPLKASVANKNSVSQLKHSSQWVQLYGVKSANQVQLTPSKVLNLAWFWLLLGREVGTRSRQVCWVGRYEQTCRQLKSRSGRSLDVGHGCCTMRMAVINP